VTKNFDGAIAVDDLSLGIMRGEFLSILGPSGCGKTTTLRMLGGFLIPDVGEIFLGGVNVTGVPPYRRDVNTVFQSYALFEHLDVADNVAFGLRRKRVGKPEIARRVGEMLDLVGLRERSRAKPAELSGGQQQRVALARALVNMPAVLLLDEPLGALDLKLRREMQIELKRIQREVGVTFVFVTHDQEEALTMSDRIAVMNHGKLQQVGRPAEIYEAPVNEFVAGFIGASNLLPGTIAGGHVALSGGVQMRLDGSRASAFRDGEEVVVSVRPEKLTITQPTPDTWVHVDGRIVDVVYLGAATNVTLEAGGDLHLLAIDFHASGRQQDRLAPGTEVAVSWDPEDALVLSNSRQATAGPPTPQTKETER
jgi:spermidine/putrescine transport system ATP-binding protein